MDKNDQLILALDRKVLFEHGHFNGFMPANQNDFEKTIIENISWAKRGDAEKDLGKKQPIVYCLIINPKLRKVFVYQRAGQGNYHEQRLWHKISCGVGGHVDKPDECENPLIKCLERELEEEVGIKKKPRLLGYINDDNAGEVEKVHFGVLYYVEVDDEALNPADGEIATGRFMSLNEISKAGDLEVWSGIAVSALKDLNLVD
jgi:predicted NUDIX family phosphoesterase